MFTEEKSIFGWSNIQLFLRRTKLTNWLSDSNFDLETSVQMEVIYNVVRYSKFKLKENPCM